MGSNRQNNKRQNRGAHYRLSAGTVESLHDRAENLAREFGVSGAATCQESTDRQDDDFGWAELLGAGVLIILSGVLTLQY